MTTIKHIQNDFEDTLVFEENGYRFEVAQTENGVTVGLFSPDDINLENPTVPVSPEDAAAFVAYLR